MKDVVRVAAVGDLHVPRGGHAGLQPMLAAAATAADVLVLCGDITDYGLPEEAKLVAVALQQTVKIPVVAVLGNHDFESGHEAEVAKILVDVGVMLLDGDAQEVEGVGFAGVKGFAGGFGPRALAPWGEPSIKNFVHEAVNEALKLEAALARLRTPQRVAVLHYAPILGTVSGEPPEIYPFLGSSRLEDPLNRYPVTAVFHGHAHRGSLEGRTREGAPVYNVAMPLLVQSFPGQPPVRIIELPTAMAAVA
ncbi:MAG TPA: metallophosphoesterase [Methylomirabilota bacterium]|jgi:Icc-related predicted phosphoesterase|nr:metallophosphoesterase [Methylomirabilota bacterium]